MMIKNHKQIDAAAQNLIQQEAQNLVDEVTGVTAVVIATIDGFSVASVTRGELDASRVAALASSISAIGQVASDEAKLGESRSVMVDTSTGFVCVYTVKLNKVDLVLTIITNAEALMAQVNYRARAVTQRISKI
jgi:uncharacterized protein